MSELERETLNKRLDKLPNGSGKRYKVPRNVDFTPRHWSEFFTSKQDLRLPNRDIFCVYRRGEEGPVILFLHGGGYSSLSFALCTVSLCEKIVCRCIAMDIRGHGDTWTCNDVNLSIDTLSNDVLRVLDRLFPSGIPPVILVGHSMGGAIAVHVGAKKLLATLQGLVVIDVVEGTATDSLSSMQSFLNSRPDMFPKLSVAIEWSIRQGQLKNVESARVSIPGHLQRVKATEIPQATTSMHSVRSFVAAQAPILEEESESYYEEPGIPPQPACSQASQHLSNLSTSGTLSVPKSTPHKRIYSAASLLDAKNLQNESDEYAYIWRIDLRKTELYWRGWFNGLSEKFLLVPAPKMILLAGMERLDKKLTIGQMQGKFQLHNFPRSGHAIHEDVPDKFSDAISTFLIRNKLAQAKTDVDW